VCGTEAVEGIQLVYVAIRMDLTVAVLGDVFIMEKGKFISLSELLCKKNYGVMLPQEFRSSEYLNVT
jgi:hypothetical protein